MGQNSNWDKTQIVTKLKLGQNSNCDKPQIVTKVIKNSSYEKRSKEHFDILKTDELSSKQRFAILEMFYIKINIQEAV